MISRQLDRALKNFPGLNKVGSEVSSTIHQAVMSGGEPARKIADTLHGTWLGHPLHPMLTDLTIGAWTFGAFFDAVAAIKGSRAAEEAADTLTEVGTLTAIPTLLSGLTDFSTIQKPAVSTATLHGVLNNVNFVLYLLSIRERRRGRRRNGVLLSATALGVSVVSAWLGGHLTYAQKVGVDQSRATGPGRWRQALDASDLSEGRPKRVEVDGNPVLLYRYEGQVLAVGAVCSHAGGPLEEGSFEDCYVQCPWHDSVFDLRDGSVHHGPATQPQPRFEARERVGKIEIRFVEP